MCCRPSVGVAFFIAAILVALAELGDKTQLLVLAFAARYRPVSVLMGVAVAVVMLQLIATIAGGAVGALVPERLVAVGAGLLFVLFGVVTWHTPGEDGAGEGRGRSTRFGPVLTVALAFFVAELGDKTQLLTLSIAAEPGAALRTLGSFVPVGVAPDPRRLSTMIGVWLGSSAGMLVADGVAIAIGSVLGAKLPERIVRRVAAVVFVLFGAVTLVSAFIGRGA